MVHLSVMIAQNTVGTCEGKQALFENTYQVKHCRRCHQCLEQIELSFLVRDVFELPSTISTMIILHISIFR